MQHYSGIMKSSRYRLLVNYTALSIGSHRQWSGMAGQLPETPLLHNSQSLNQHLSPLSEWFSVLRFRAEVIRGRDFFSPSSGFELGPRASSPKRALRPFSVPLCIVPSESRRASPDAITPVDVNRDNWAFAHPQKKGYKPSRAEPEVPIREITIPEGLKLGNPAALLDD